MHIDHCTGMSRWFPNGCKVLTQEGVGSFANVCHENSDSDLQSDKILWKQSIDTVLVSLMLLILP